MSNADETDTSVPLSWIVIFLLLTLGLGAAGVLMVGGELISSSGLLLPALA